jgi:hypothetical protein
MRTLAIIEFVTLDGVMEPESCTPTTTGVLLLGYRRA